MPRPQPLWICPRCGQRFVTRNMWHSCVRMSVRDHLTGKPTEVVDLYRAYAKMVRSLGPGVRAVAVKSGIGFMVRVRFAGATLQQRGLRVGFWLKREVRSPRFVKAEHLERDNWIYHVKVRTAEDLDDELLGWLREAYLVGRQEWGSVQRGSSERAPWRLPRPGVPPLSEGTEERGVSNG